MSNAGGSSRHHHQHRRTKPSSSGDAHAAQKHSASRNADSQSTSSAASTSSHRPRPEEQQETVLVHRLISYYYNLHRVRKAEKGAGANNMASKDTEADEPYDKSKNFLRQFRDKSSKQLKKFSATQFMEVWNHYDSDGKLRNTFLFLLVPPNVTMSQEPHPPVKFTQLRHSIKVIGTNPHSASRHCQQYPMSSRWFCYLLHRVWRLSMFTTHLLKLTFARLSDSLLIGCRFSNFDTP